MGAAPAATRSAFTAEIFEPRLPGSSWNFGDGPHGLMVRR
jgi:hypothetical protein